MPRARKLLAASFLAAGGCALYACVIYDSSLLLPASDGGKGDTSRKPDVLTETGGGCMSGTTECTAGMVQKCVSGKWVVQEVCTNGCSASGGCVPSPSCVGGGPG